VTKLDRLARSLPDARDIVDELTTREVKLNLGGSVYDPTDPVGRHLFNVLAMVAEFESDLSGCAHAPFMSSTAPTTSALPSAGLPGSARPPEASRPRAHRLRLSMTNGAARARTTSPQDHSVSRRFDSRIILVSLDNPARQHGCSPSHNSDRARRSWSSSEARVRGDEFT
jgi:hypothetical protein